MINRHRGEIAAEFDGNPMRLCLTLGALAELEHAFGDADLLALAARFEKGRLSAADAIKIIGAGLRGGGQDVTDEAVGKLRIENGAVGYVAIVAELLVQTFGGDAPENTGFVGMAKEGPSTPEPRPFPGAM
jgi:hypothetical protein